MMKIIILGDKLNQSRSIEFPTSWLMVATAIASIGLMIFVVSLYVMMERGNKLSLAEQDLQQLYEEILFEQNKLDEFYTYSDAVFLEYAKQAGNLQARLARLEALGGRLADMADFEDEFDFYSRPAVGGPDTSTAKEQTLHADVLETMKQLSSSLSAREQELNVIDSLLADKQLYKERYVAGKPVQSGWLSSHYGKRIDPFHGKVSWHKGVDFAGKEGSNILAVASGVVVWSGDRYGFGQLVEIDHGNNFKTRYAHNRKNLVNMGDVVTKGQMIAEMGSSGRSTGPHVHFEVLKNGRSVDPVRYIYRASM